MTARIVPTFEEVSALLQENGGESTTSRQALRKYFQSALVEYSSVPEAAYHIAGLLALPQIAALSETDPYRNVISMAGDAELPRRHQEHEDSWWRLQRAITELPH